MKAGIINWLVATGDVAKTGEEQCISAFGIAVTRGGPTVWTTKLNIIRRVVGGVDDGGVRGFAGEMFERTLVWAGLLVVDGDHVATEKGGNPVAGAVGEVDTAADADVRAGVIDGELTGGDLLAVISADLGPLEDVHAV